MQVVCNVFLQRIEYIVQLFSGIEKSPVIVLRKRFLLDKIFVSCYNYIVINYNVIMECEANIWHSETIHLTIRS